MGVEIKSPSFCAQCRSRCGCNVVVENGKLLRIEPLASHPSGEKLCPKGLATPELVYHPDRLTVPLRRTSPKGQRPATWEPVSWDEAMTEIADRMRDIRDHHGAEQVAFSVTTPSGTQISDGIAWIERFIRCYGSPNTIYGTEICNWHKDVASRLTYGTDIGTPDFAATDCVLLWGNNPAATWLARSVEIQKAIKRGAKLVVVDPRPVLFARRADCWLRVKPGTDQALALGLAHLMIESGRFDQEFVRRWSNGPFLVRDDNGRFLRETDVTPGGSETILLAAANDPDSLLRYDMAAGTWLDDPQRSDLFAQRTVDGIGGRIGTRTAFSLFAVAAASYPPDQVERVTGVAAAAVQAAADTLTSSRSVAYYAWNGVGQSVTATQTDRAISLLYAITGSYSGQGGNVPGSAAPFADISGHELLTDAQRAKALGLTERPIGPAQTGWVTARDVYRAITHHKPYPVRMLFSFGTNLLASQPDTNLARDALSRLEFHVHTDFFPNASAEYADVVLPVATSWEREGLRTGFDASLEGMRRVQLRPPAIAPVGEARSDTDVILDLAGRLGMAKHFFGLFRDLCGWAVFRSCAAPTRCCGIG
jgi:anaerobic selenocysteine-containing dehydrogenase